MVTWTFRFHKKIALAVLGGLAAATVTAVALSTPWAGAVSVLGRGTSTAAATNEERVEFIAARGLEVEQVPISKMEVTIPEEFDSIYVGYNQIQQSQGFDLEKYRGRTVTKYSYAVKAPQGQEPRMVASLLVYEDRVIGADLSARELGGMIRALEGETAEP